MNKPKTPGQAAYEEYSRQAGLIVHWRRLSKPSKQSWENIAQAAVSMDDFIRYKQFIQAMNSDP